ncbi:hypothetical protein DICPUDRAFT_154468 [Dictyostelium purpureum]|uniref:Uncharacterized protein n=1 Tax=Dictyostelium purpureum TaxID=5786 RepID=F0ZRE6_DICPU|nr:uncharacterized protein DICPUDRAFT_154468 [Dictyostelium purpureum]EGC33478.1 hypothetical protein DICPUDRAFT_154468 [Dictyostelium purpureum]|eukprot:XP_003290001.1 hypothetical protein DICPUDRAFT_154468 [Dictyostelium purpureum]
MEMNLTFTENRSIKVIILPIGDISPEKYKEYTSLIKTINIIELSSITRSQNESTPFEKISWVDGSMLLNFVDASSYQRSEYEEFQTYKKVFGVIGVVDCKKSKDLMVTKKLFEQAVNQYPSCVSSLCCAFDPMDDQQDLGLGANLIMIPNNSDRKHLIFYLTTLLIDFSHMILKHFEKVVSESDASSGNTSGIGLSINTASGSSTTSTNNSLITTPLDSVKLWDEINRAKKRKAGRLNKCKGDYCLLAGSPLDAFKYYDQSLESCRNNSDLEWLGGSCEGYISAVLLKRNQEYNQQNHSTKPLSPNITFTPGGPGYSGVGSGPNSMSATDIQIQGDDTLIKDLANEAIQSYNKRKTVRFEIDVILKFANYHISMDRKIEASELLTNANDISWELTFHDRIPLACSIGLLYYSMGFKRKFAFYLREAAFLFTTKPENWEKISNLLLIASKYYQLDDLFANSPSTFLDENTNKTLSFTLNQIKKSNSVTRSGSSSNKSSPSGQQFQPQNNQFYPSNQQQQQQQGSSSKPLIKFNTNIPDLSIRKPKYGWTTIQRYIIYNLISVSSNLNDSLNICKYIIYLLRTQYKQIAQTKQHEFQVDLSHHSKALPLSINTNVHMNSLGLPFITKVIPMSLPEHLEPIVRPNTSSNSTSARDKFFIYSPYEKTEQSIKKIIWTEQEECSVLVTLSNPFSFDIFIQSLTLSTAGVPFESYPLSFKILSLTESMDIVISGRALCAGPLIIKGVFIRSYNLLSEYPINPQGRAISLNEYYDLVRKDAYKVEAWEVPVEPDETVINKIKVVPRLPLLNVYVPTMGNTLNLFAGESCTFNFKFENIGCVPIESIIITLNEFDKTLKKKVLSQNEAYLTDQDDESISYSWNSNIIQSNLPLLPGKSFNLPIEIFTKPFLIGNQFVINYYSNNGNQTNSISVSIPSIEDNSTTTALSVNNNANSIVNYQRKISIPLQMFITHGPKLHSFDIVYASSKTIKSLSPYLLEKPTQQQEGSTSLSSSLSNLSINSSGYLEIPENIYNDYCLLLFDIENCTSTHTFTISSQLNNVDNHQKVLFEKSMSECKFILSPNSIITIVVPMKREALPESLPMLRQARGQYIKPKKKLTEYEEYMNRLIQYYKDLFIQNIRLNWTSSDNTKGIILLNNIKLTPKRLQKLNNDSVLIEFKDNQLLKNVQLGEFTSIEVSVKNLTNQVINGLVLHIQPTIDQQLPNKLQSLNDLSKKLGYVGSLTTPISELQPNSTYNHKLDVIFFERESFKFIVTCELFKTKQIIPSTHSLTIMIN